jgi:hypothetical protein
MKKFLLKQDAEHNTTMLIMIVSWIEVFIRMLMTNGSPFPFAELALITKMG